MKLENVWAEFRKFGPAGSLALSLILIPLAPSLAETDPAKCAMINLANYYLRCADINAKLGMLLGDGNSSAPKVRKAVKLVEELKMDFLAVAVSLYKVSGSELTVDVMKERTKQNQPYVEAAVIEFLEQTRATINGRKPAPGTSMVDLCTRPQLGTEIRDATRLDARLKEFVAEANQLRASQASCIK
jgi:hypothetical protein